jgi:lipopolysaccharide export system permease protein
MIRNYINLKSLGMPKLWSYLIKKFFTHFAFTFIGIIIFLIVIRFSSIAGFATSGTDLSLIFKFIGFLIPYVIPLAIPISVLNATLLISRKLSLEKQFTALRSGGLSLKKIFTPLIIVFSFLTVLNFFNTGTLAPYSKLKSKTLIYETTVKHPLFITQKACPLKIKSLYTDVGKMSSKDCAQDLIVAFKNKKNQRLSLMVADKLFVKKENLSGKNIGIISSLKSKNTDLQDDLVIENEAFMTTSTHVIDVLLNKKEAQDGVDYLDFFQLIKNWNTKNYYKSELYKRLNLSLAPLTFGILGLCFGLNISRKSSSLSLAIAIGLATLFMVTNISSKSYRSQPELCMILYLASHLIVIFASFIKLKRIEKGLG